MSLLKVSVLLPAFLSGLWVGRSGGEPSSLSATSSSGGIVPVCESSSGPEPRKGDDSEKNAARDSGSVAEATLDSKAAERSFSSRIKQDEIAIEVIVGRRLRIERILFSLETMAEASVQMSPDHASLIEPVITDLAEQTIELTDSDAVMDSSTDDEIEEIEKTLDQLVTAVERMVEPEMSL